MMVSRHEKRQYPPQTQDIRSLVTRRKKTQSWTLKDSFSRCSNIPTTELIFSVLKLIEPFRLWACNQVNHSFSCSEGRGFRYLGLSLQKKTACESVEITRFLGVNVPFLFINSLNTTNSYHWVAIVEIELRNEVKTVITTWLVITRWS